MGRTIRFKITFWFSLALIVVALVTFALFRLVSGSVLNRTMRDYLVSTVESNTDDVTFIRSYAEAKDITGGSIFIEYEDGFLEVDDDFLDVVNAVNVSLYRSDGTLLYGINPIARGMDGIAFAASRQWHLMQNGIRYEIYDRALPVKNTTGLWLRGVMPADQAQKQLADITAISMVLLPSLIFLSVLGGYLIAGRLLAPLRRIEQRAAEISGGNDLKKRIALKGPDDEVHRLAGTFDNMIGRLDASFEAEREFAKNASHALRTPATVILAECEHTLEKERTVPEYEDALRTIRRQAAKMSGQIIETIVHFRRDHLDELTPMYDENTANDSRGE